MKLESAKIPSIQLMFSVTCFLQASSLLTAFLAGVTGYDSWFAVVMGIILFLPFLLLYIGLMKTFPGDNLMEINDKVFGKVAGKIFSGLHILFFLTLASLNLRDLNVFVKQTIMDKTPDVVLMGICILVSTLAVRYGITVVTRYSFLFVLTAGTVLVVTILLSANLMDINNFLPMLQQPPIKYVQGTNIILSIPFGEMVIFLMVMPYVREKKKPVGRYLLWGFYLGALMLLLVVVRDTAVLGNTLSLYAMPAYETLRVVTLMGSLSRMEILFAVVLIVLLFFKITILHYVSSLAIAQLFGMKSYRPIALITGVLILNYAFTLYPSNIQHMSSGRETSTILWQVFEFVLPAITLAGGKIRQRKMKGAAG